MITVLLGTLFFVSGTICQAQATYRADDIRPGETEHWQYRIIGCNSAPNFEGEVTVHMRANASGTGTLDIPGYGTLVGQPTDQGHRDAIAALKFERNDKWKVRAVRDPLFGGYDIHLVR